MGKKNIALAGKGRGKDRRYLGMGVGWDSGGAINPETEGRAVDIPVGRAGADSQQMYQHWGKNG